MCSQRIEEMVQALWPTVLLLVRIYVNCHRVDLLGLKCTVVPLADSPFISLFFSFALCAQTIVVGARSQTPKNGDVASKVQDLISNNKVMICKAQLFPVNLFSVRISHFIIYVSSFSWRGGPQRAPAYTLANT